MDTGSPSARRLMQINPVGPLPPTSGAEKVRVYTQFDNRIPQWQRKTDDTGKCVPGLFACCGLVLTAALLCLLNRTRQMTALLCLLNRTRQIRALPCLLNRTRQITVLLCLVYNRTRQVTAMLQCGAGFVWDRPGQELASHLVRWRDGC